jgi:hypothetical protein
MALLRHSKIADGLPLSGEERSCSGHQRDDRVWTHIGHAAIRELSSIATGSFWPNVGGLDHRSPFLDLALNELSEIFRRSPLRRDQLGSGKRKIINRI